MFLVFFVTSAVLLPFAYFKSLLYKLKQILKSQTTMEYAKSIAEVCSFLIFGLPVSLLTFITDCYYFWKNNFRDNLKKIVIEREPSTITNYSIHKIKKLCDKYTGHRIKAVFGIDFVKRFREDLDINSLLQFLIFG